MDKRTIYSKTGKGVLEIKNKAGKLSKDLVKVLTLIDGKSTIADLISKARYSEAEIERALSQLSSSGFIKQFTNTSGSMQDSALESSYVDDLDFTSSLSPGKNVYQSAQTEWRARESADRAKAEQEAKKKREEEERLKKEQAARHAREEAERLAKVEVERKAKEAAALKLRDEADRKAKIEAEAMVQTTRDLQKTLEAERKALEQSERKRQEEAEFKRREDAERRNREDAERKRREEEERRRQEEEARRKREEEEVRRKEEEERKRREEAARRREEEARRRQEEEERKKREAEEAKRREEEERKRREEEERRRQEEEARRKREEEERKRKEEEERKRREEEERLRLEEQERKRREEEEQRLRREEEDRRRKEEDERRQREDEERRSRDEEERRRREEDERREREEAEARRSREQDEARRDEEERARAENAAKSNLPEFDLSGLKSMETQIASEFERQQDELRRREEQEERRRQEEEQARLAIERAEREEEARLEAERREAEDRDRRERMERERMEREERERLRQEEREQRIREQEERKLKAELERQREEERRIEIERREREEELARRRKEQEERDRKRAEVEALKKQKAIRTPLERFRPLIIGVVVVLVVVVGGVQLIPLNTYIPAIEKLTSDHIKEPVSIGSMRLSLFGGFAIRLENVKLGATQDVNIEKVTLSPELGSVFSDVKVIKRVEVESVKVAQEVLPRLPKWMEAAVADRNVEIGRVVLKSVKLESRTVDLPNFDADLHLGADGLIQKAALSTTDGKLKVDVTPRGEDFALEVTAGKGWVPPLGPKIEFTDFSAKAVVTRNQVRVEQFESLLYGGVAKGRALINWGGPWSIDGEVTTERIALQDLMEVFSKEAKSSGQLESRVRYSMVSADLATLFDSPKIDGSFNLKKGDLDGVDLVRALQMGGRQNVQGGATRFEEITGTFSVANGRYHYRNLKLASGLLSATGGFEVSPNKDISGRLYVELKSQAAQIRGNFIVDGNLKAIVLRPAN